MMRKVSFQAALAVTAFAVSAVFAPACAQDAEEAPAAAAAEDGLPSPQPEAKPFTALFKCLRVTGVAQVLTPGASEWAVAQEGRYYPLGSSVRTLKEAGASGAAEFSFGPESSLKLEGASEVATRPIEIGEPSRTVVLKSGRVCAFPDIARRLEENNIIVNYQATPDEEGFTASGALRMGVSEMTRFGFGQAEFETLAGLMADCILRNKDISKDVCGWRVGLEPTTLGTSNPFS